LDQVAQEIRKIRGYENFLCPAVYDDIARAARLRPLVYVASTQIGGIAVLVPGGPEATPVATRLPALTDVALTEQLSRLFDPAADAIEDLTQWLWTSVMEPVISMLEGRPQVSLVPIGMLALAPLHIAWTQYPASGARQYALDQCLITYTPTARALTECHARASRQRTSALLIVDNPQPGAAPLRTDLEVASAKAAFTDHRHLCGTDATPLDVQAELGSVGNAHFACHASAVPTEPLTSALILAGGARLTLRELMEQRLNLRLAVLSACETALPGVDLPNEVVTLAAAFLEAGAAGAIASGWPVPDRSTNLLMAAFYDELARAPSPAEALRRAQQWLRSADNTAISKRFPQAATPPGRPGSAVRRLWERAHPHAGLRAWSGFSYTGW